MCVAACTHVPQTSQTQDPKPRSPTPRGRKTPTPAERRPCTKCTMAVAANRRANRPTNRPTNQPTTAHLSVVQVVERLQDLVHQQPQPLRRQALSYTGSVE